jgi:hypothetical protein
MLLKRCPFGRLRRVVEQTLLLMELSRLVLSGSPWFMLFDKSGEVGRALLVQFNRFALDSLRLIVLAEGSS